MSVIVPAFDAAANIRQTLNSVLSQRYQQIEAVVVDDGSSDATSAVVGEFVADFGVPTKRSNAITRLVSSIAGPKCLMSTAACSMTALRQIEGHLRHALIRRNVIGNGSVPLFRAAVSAAPVPAAKRPLESDLDVEPSEIPF
jgi:glycosyltransferase involved in cell wall biosynthesis